MSDRTGRARYRHIGGVYDALSLERWLYSRPRRRLHHLIGPQPGATIVDAGCGTGLNFEGLLRLVGPSGRVVGVDASRSMLAAARQRTKKAGWDNVQILQSDIGDLTAALGRSGIQISDIDGVIATFVVSTLPDPTSFWLSVDEMIASQPGLLIALADLGEADEARRIPALALNAFAALGGNQQFSQPWDALAQRSSDVFTERHLGGHVHLSVGHCHPRS